MQWKTAQEINNAWFEVQRSTDGRNWIKLSVQYPQPSHDYKAIDYDVSSGICYYRVKQVDNDGNFIYSTIKAIKINGNNEFSLWPNPVTEYLFIETRLTNGTIEITDVSGKIMQKRIINTTITTLPVHQLAKGLYVVRIKRVGEVFTQKFIKE